jgi:hypothetical protein
MQTLNEAEALDDQFFVGRFSLAAKHFLLFEFPLLASKYVIEFR